MRSYQLLNPYQIKKENYTENGFKEFSLIF